MGLESEKTKDMILRVSGEEKIKQIQDPSELCIAEAGVEEAVSALRRCLEGLYPEQNAKQKKQWRCRSRKRFIKLLMSSGYDRNYAARTAERARRVGIPYQEVWRTWYFWLWERL